MKKDVWGSLIAEEALPWPELLETAKSYAVLYILCNS